MFCAFRASKKCFFHVLGSWRLLGLILGLLGSSWGPPWGPPGRLLGRSSGLLTALGGSWRLLGRSWRLLARSCAFLGASLGLLAGPRPRQGPILDATRAQRGQKSHKTYENTFRNHCSERLSRPLQPRCTEPRMHSTMLAQWPVWGRRPTGDPATEPSGSRGGRGAKRHVYPESTVTSTASEKPSVYRR